MQELYKKLKIIGALVAGLLVIIIVLQNTESVETKLLFMTLTMPRAAMLFGTLLIGFALGVITTMHLMKSGRKKPGDESTKEST